VPGLPLTDSTLVYYYTYGSIVAALSRPDANNCPDALNVLEEVRAKYGSDSTVAGIVQSGEAICQSLGTAGAVSGATPTSIPTQAFFTSTPYPTANPATPVVP
jgi:hypothetical protein